MSTLHTWWTDRDGERFWLEVTDREDLGANLKAPQANEKGSDFWSYSLLKEVQPGDVVFHYDRSIQSIVAASVVTSQFWSDKILWAARGTYAREAGIEPHVRDGWYVGLESFAFLPEPVSLRDIRQRADDVSAGLANLESDVGQPTYFPFERGMSRPIRPIQGYLFKLPQFFVELFPTLETYPSGSSRRQKRESRGSRRIGASYRPADETSAVAERDPFSVDPALVERGVRGHAATQNLLAEFLLKGGLDPRSPLPDEPSFDLAWEKGDTVWVAEVKSLTEQNEEKQLRLGLGQVLRYRYLMASSFGMAIKAVIAVERKPSDRTWTELCTELGVTLIWPQKFRKLLD